MTFLLAIDTTAGRRIVAPAATKGHIHRMCIDSWPALHYHVVHVPQD
jgi:hypothetical protein